MQLQLQRDHQRTYNTSAANAEGENIKSHLHPVRVLRETHKRTTHEQRPTAHPFFRQVLLYGFVHGAGRGDHAQPSGFAAQRPVRGAEESRQGRLVQSPGGGHCSGNVTIKRLVLAQWDWHKGTFLHASATRALTPPTLQVWRVEACYRGSHQQVPDDVGAVVEFNLDAHLSSSYYVVAELWPCAGDNNIHERSVARSAAAADEQEDQPPDQQRSRETPLVVPGFLTVVEARKSGRRRRLASERQGAQNAKLRTSCRGL